MSKIPQNHTRKLTIFILVFTLLIFSLTLACKTSQAPDKRSLLRNVDQHPAARLVLLIAVDQFRYDYMDRFARLYGDGGIRRLLRDGGSWTNANYDHIPTYTAPGHSTMLTGAWPSETGIVGNDWPDRETGKHVTSVTDTKVTILGGGSSEGGSSPRRLMASTVGDELRLKTHGRSKVVGISLKDRAAILPVGRDATAAYWLSSETGSMVSSTYYFSRLPDWVDRFNASRPADKYYGAVWNRLLPESDYLKYAGEDGPSWELESAGIVRPNARFPHTINSASGKPDREYYESLDASPFSNELLVSFAEQAIENEQLGTDDDTDVLTVSFSANDYVGHRYGPYSQEVMDMALNVDLDISALLDFVDKKVGLQNTIVAFTADHGMAPIPEQAATVGLAGGRIDATELLNAIRTGIGAELGSKHITADPKTDFLFSYAENATPRDSLLNANIYFNQAAIKTSGANETDIEEAACASAMTVSGVSRCFTRTQLTRGSISDSDPVGRRALHGFYPKRSGDIVLIYDSFKYLGETISATHGSPYSYDTHVPLVLMGGGVRPGRYQNAATPADIAPTLSSILRVQPPSNSVGRILLEGLQNGDR